MAAHHLPGAGVTSDAEVMRLSPEQEQLLKVVAGLAPATAGQVSAALGKLSRHLQTLSDLLAVADKASTIAADAYQEAYDKAFLAAGFEEIERGERVTDTFRNTVARMATRDLHLELELAKLEVRRLRQAMKTLDRRIFVGQSQAATVRSEHRTIGYAS
jgi:hypothetical protein